jgi:hypothetical protein
MAALVLAGAAVLAMAGAVLACSTTELGITAGGCSGQASAATRTWTVTNSYTAESIAWANNSGFSGAITLTPQNAGSWSVQTAATVNILYVRFVGNPTVSISKTWDGGACPTATPTPTPTPTATPTATPTPFETQAGETGTPDPSVTPPPTSSSRGSSGPSTPIFALLICLAFGAIGLSAVEAQRRSVRR